MVETRDALLLRIYIGENARYEGQPIYERLVMKAREMRLAGATVLRGVLGFGRCSRVHTAKILRLSEDLPLVIEIVDNEARIESFLDVVADMTAGCLVTLEKVRVVQSEPEEDARDA